MGHARALLSLTTVEQQRQVCQRIVNEGLSVREVEKLASAGTRQRRTATVRSTNAAALEDSLRQALGTRVSVIEGRKGRGKIVVDFYTHDEFERLFEKLTG